MTKLMGHGVRQQQFTALLDTAGQVGMSYRELAAASGTSPENARSVCNWMRRHGMLARVGGRFVLMRHLPADVVQDGPQVRAPDAKPRHNPAAPRGFDPRMLERATFIRTKCQTTFGDMVVPPGTPITVVAAPRGRFEPSPGHVGEFTRQWQEARA